MEQLGKRLIKTREDGTKWIQSARGWTRYGPGPWCGTSSGYTNHGCRCDDCKAWKAKASKAYASSENGKKIRKEAAKQYSERRRHQRQVHMHAAVKTVNSIFYILDRVGTGELTAEEAVSQVIKRYG